MLQICVLYIFKYDKIYTVYVLHVSINIYTYMHILYIQFFPPSLPVFLPFYQQTFTEFLTIIGIQQIPIPFQLLLLCPFYMPGIELSIQDVNYSKNRINKLSTLLPSSLISQDHSAPECCLFQWLSKLISVLMGNTQLGEQRMD